MKKVLSILLLCAVQSFGALNAYLYLAGETQGEIKGSVTQAGREDSIMVIGTSHEVVSPRDAATGLPTGRRQHKPFTITKQIDKSTPLLLMSMVLEERMTNFQLRYWKPSVSGMEEQFYTINLIGAKVCAIKQEMLNNEIEANLAIAPMEKVSFTYEDIEFVWEEGGINASDKWDYQSSRINLTDLSGDGVVDIIDLAVLADDWLARTASAE